MTRKSYPSDVSEEEWHFVAPYLTLMDVNAPQRRHDLPPWQMVYQQFRRWDEAGCFEAMVNDMRSVIRVSEGRRGQPSAVVLDGRTLQSSCETADEQERVQVKALCEAVQEATGETVKLAWADQGYTGEQARQDAQASDIDLQIVKLPEARKGFVLLPRRWVVERSFGWLSRFRRLSRYFERLPQVLASLHATLMLPKVAAPRGPDLPRPAGPQDRRSSRRSRRLLAQADQGRRSQLPCLHEARRTRPCR